MSDDIRFIVREILSKADREAWGRAELSKALRERLELEPRFLSEVPEGEREDWLGVWAKFHWENGDTWVSPIKEVRDHGAVALVEDRSWISHGLGRDYAVPERVELMPELPRCDVQGRFSRKGNLWDEEIESLVELKSSRATLEGMEFRDQDNDLWRWYEGEWQIRDFNDPGDTWEDPKTFSPHDTFGPYRRIK